MSKSKTKKTSQITKVEILKLMKQEKFLRDKIFDGTDIAFLDQMVLPLLDKDKPIYLLEAFRNCVYSGITPPARILSIIAECIDNYLSANGKIKLDEAFLVKSRQGSRGNPVEEANYIAQLSEAFWNIWRLRTYPEHEMGKPVPKRPSIEKAAEEVISTLKLKFEVNHLKTLYIKSKYEVHMNELLNN